MNPGRFNHCSCLGIEADPKLHLDLFGLLREIPHFHQRCIREYADLIHRALKARSCLDDHLIRSRGPLNTGLIVGYLHQHRSTSRLEPQQLIHRSPIASR